MAGFRALAPVDRTGTRAAETILTPVVSSGGLLEKLFKSSHEIDKMDSENFTDLAEFEHVQPPRSRFVVADKGLRFSE